jgi:NMD protein affecting ribosome stability and mRNA decay
VGLHYVYEGNIYSDGAHTCCPSCQAMLIRRSWHDVEENRLVNGCCPKCGLAIPGRWENADAGIPAAVSRRAELLAGKRYGELNL